LIEIAHGGVFTGDFKRGFGALDLGLRSNIVQFNQFQVTFGPQSFSMQLPHPINIQFGGGEILFRRLE
jgi:hypothetical protein